MSNGDSPDGFVFPPFIPPSAARAPAPQPAPAPPAPSPAPAPAAMPWDVETPVREGPEEPAAAAEEAPGEELPWLELPEPREAAAPPVPEDDAGEGPLPDWMTWDARAEQDAEAELSGTAPLEGLEEFDPVASFGAAEEPLGADAGAEEEALSFGEADPFSFGAPAAREELAEAEGASGEIAGLELAGGYGFTAEAEEGVYPGAATEEGAGFAPEPLEDPFAVAEPPAGPAPFVADVEAVLAAEPDPFTAAEIAATEAEEPGEPPAVEAVEELHAAGEPAGRDAGAPGAFDAVAARLEEIARTLRERPDELLAGGSGDPLALLVTGYVMGYRQGRGR